MKAYSCGIYTLAYFETLSSDEINETVLQTGGRITETAKIPQLQVMRTKEWMIVHLACGVIFFKPKNHVSRLIACGATARRVARIAEPYGLSQAQIMALYNECSVLTDDEVLDAGIVLYESGLETGTPNTLKVRNLLSFDDPRLVKKSLRIARELYEASL